MVRRLWRRFRDWLDDRFDMHLRFDGDLMTPDWHESDGDPHLRRTAIVTPQQHAARLKDRRHADHPR